MRTSWRGLVGRGELRPRHKGPVGFEDADERHGLAAAGTVWRCSRLIGFAGRRRAEHEGHAGLERDPLAFGFGGRMAKSVVADGVHFAGQDVAQVSANELDAGEVRLFHAVAFVAVFPLEGHRVGIAGQDAAVADGGAADVGPEVFDGGDPRAEGLDVDPPADAPHGGIHFPVQSLEAHTKLMPEAGLEGRNVDEELFAIS